MLRSRFASQCGLDFFTCKNLKIANSDAAAAQSGALFSHRHLLFLYMLCLQSTQVSRYPPATSPNKECPSNNKSVIEVTLHGRLSASRISERKRAKLFRCIKYANCFAPRKLASPIPLLHVDVVVGSTANLASIGCDKFLTNLLDSKHEPPLWVRN